MNNQKLMNSAKHLDTLAKVISIAFKVTGILCLIVAIALLLIIILSVLILIGKICLESNIKTVFTGAKMNVDKPASYCGECGNQIPYGSRVCSVCGMPVADDIYAESQNNSDDKNFSISIIAILSQ